MEFFGWRAFKNRREVGSLEGVLKMPVTVCNAPLLKMRCADFQEIWEIASLPEGPLKRKNVLIAAISKHPLSSTLSISIEFETIKWLQVLPIGLTACKV